jgi:hypothetical protein
LSSKGRILAEGIKSLLSLIESGTVTGSRLDLSVGSDSSEILTRLIQNTEKSQLCETLSFLKSRKKLGKMKERSGILNPRISESRTLMEESEENLSILLERRRGYESSRSGFRLILNLD